MACLVPVPLAGRAHLRRYRAGGIPLKAIYLACAAAGRMAPSVHSLSGLDRPAGLRPLRVDADAILPKSEQVEHTPSSKELIPVRASGWFTVEGKEQYLVDIEADLRATGSAERIIVGRVHPSRFLLLGRWPRGELGWWYLFLKPEAIREMQVGYLNFGLRARASLRLVCDSDKEGVRQAFISSTDAPVIKRVWDSLRHNLDCDVHGTRSAAHRSGSG